MYVLILQLIQQIWSKWGLRYSISISGI
uniref:Uncharacterized protein n=1 Tax=Rhizophora mucronata TaxID=61149 RepID=A0A2P2N850_RHIMU